ncbi:MAG: YchJ family protein [Treponema sp.]|jgi:SEC-C motif-containing protein|nr:YchJ family protein [Treponema sp.]
MKPCPCGSGLEYANCCEPYITGAKNAPSAEALMRSRYTAYAVGAIDHIIKSCLDTGKNRIDYRETKNWSEKSEWLGLKIISVNKGGPDDNEGTVEFEAAYERDHLKDIHHEKAKFKKKEGLWFYDEGEVFQKTVVRTGAKIGRNEPCTCGSGKKYKHCCGR